MFDFDASDPLWVLSGNGNSAGTRQTALSGSGCGGVFIFSVGRMLMHFAWAEAQSAIHLNERQAIIQPRPGRKADEPPSLESTAASPRGGLPLEKFTVYHSRIAYVKAGTITFSWSCTPNPNLRRYRNKHGSQAKPVRGRPVSQAWASRTSTNAGLSRPPDFRARQGYRALYRLLGQARESWYFHDD